MNADKYLNRSPEILRGEMTQIYADEDDPQIAQITQISLWVYIAPLADG